MSEETKSRAEIWKCWLKGVKAAISNVEFQSSLFPSPQMRNFLKTNHPTHTDDDDDDDELQSPSVLIAG